MKIYSDQEFEALLQADSMDLFDEWLDDAKRLQPINHNAMTLATVDQTGMPQARTVLLKERDEHGFKFFTNSESRKGRALAGHPKGALLFFWRALDRQILIEGHVKKLSAEETNVYYGTRPRESRIGAWASNQSRPLKSYAKLHEAVLQRQQEFADSDPPLPPYWQGYILHPIRIEFWQEGEYRLHRRIAFTFQKGKWEGQLLQP